MGAVDLWFVVAAVLFGVAALTSLPKLATPYATYAMAFVSAGLMCFMIGTLVARN